MLKKLVIGIAALVIAAVSPGAQQTSKSLSLRDCILVALKNNLGVHIAALSPDIAEANLAWAREKFLPRLSFGYNNQRTNSASYSWIDAAGSVKTRYNDLSATVSQSIPTGGAVSASLSGYKSESNLKFQTINPRYGSTLSFSFSQPLLRNFGSKMSRRDILISQNSLDISESQLQAVLLETIYNVEQAYWNLIYAIENLSVKQQSLDLARDLVSKNRREAEVGMVAPIEILSAEAEVATREADILQAEVAVANSEDTLKTVINIAAEEGSGLVRIVPSDKPNQEPRSVSVDEALKQAIANRPDLRVTRISLKTRELNLAYAKNQVLPDLSLYASYWSPGLSGTQILYLDNDPLTDTVIGTVPSGAGAALSRALGLKYSNWAVGVQLSLPISSLLTRSQYEASRLSYEQSLVDLANLEQRIFLEIRTAVRAVETDYKRVLAYKAARELAENKLAAEAKKLSVGLTTNYVVLQYQRDLADARTAELRAIIEYNLALAYLDKSLGTSLESKDLEFAPARRSG